MDAAGRHGIAVARVDATDGQRTEWIFDRKTYAYLGVRQVEVTGAEPGSVLGQSAVLSRAVVDRPWSDRPGQTG